MTSSHDLYRQNRSKEVLQILKFEIVSTCGPSASVHRKQNLKKLSDKLRYIECGISNCLFCLEWRCGKFIEIQRNKLIEEAENDSKAGFIDQMAKVNVNDICSSWTSINQLLNDWFLPGIR